MCSPTPPFVLLPVQVSSRACIRPPSALTTCVVKPSHHPLCAVLPEYLRAAGYYCTNNAKTDYNFTHDPKIGTPTAAPLTAWDESSPKAHWRNRPKGAPFFAVFTITVTHESQIRSREEGLLKRLAALSPGERRDPAKAPVLPYYPAYYPDTPVVRRDIARHYQ